MRLSANKGFTLPELLLASLILILALSGMLTLFVSCIFLNDASANLSTAVTHAEYILEEIREAGFSGLEDRINSNNGTPAGWDLDTAEIQATYGIAPLRSERITTAVSSSGNPLGVAVGVSWVDRTGRARDTELRTMVTDY